MDRKPTMADTLDKLLQEGRAKAGTTRAHSKASRGVPPGSADDKLRKITVENTNGDGPTDDHVNADNDLTFEVEDDPRPLIAEGIYLGLCKKVEFVPIAKFGNAPRLFLWFSIFPLGAQPIESMASLYLVCTAPRKWDKEAKRWVNTPLGRGSRLYRAFVIANGSAPTRRDRLSMKVFLGKLFQVSVRTVRPTRSDGREHDSALHYSVVDELLIREA